MSHVSRESVSAALSALIFPNTPHTQEELAAFDQAVSFQLEHLTSAPELPDGIESMQIGHFQIRRSSGSGSSRYGGVCPAAYGVLLRAGLLYKGVERVPYE